MWTKCKQEVIILPYIQSHLGSRRDN